MGQSKIQKKVIEFNLDVENRPLKEDITKESINKSTFREQYKNALNSIEQYLTIARNDSHDKELDSQNNIFLFVGDRGSGKTSCMLSVGGFLLKEKSRRSEFKDDYPEIGNVDFYSVDLIDPSYFDTHYNIISLFLAKLFAKYREKAKRDSTITENKKIRFLNALTTTQKHAQLLLEPSNSTELNIVERLESLSAAVDLKEDLKKLVDAYFECLGLNDSILLLRIDDIDLNAKEGNIMVEHIRKYFIQSNILVLMALKLDQLEIIKKNEFAELFKLKDKDELIDNMADRYLTKIFPQNQRIYTPNINDILEKELIVCVKGEKVKYPSVRQIVPQLIFQKTRYLFYNSPTLVSYIVPRNLRELRQLIKMLWDMPDYYETIDNDLNIVKNGAYNKVVFKEYLKNTWIKNNLNPKSHRFARHLLTMNETILLNNFIVQSLKGDIWSKKYALDVEPIKSILDEKNYAYNISAGDVLAVITYLRQKNMDLDDQKLLFFITAVYSIRLYEAYNIVTEEYKIPFKAEDVNVVSEENDVDKEIFSIAQYKSINDYEKLLLGYVFNTKIHHFFSNDLLEHRTKIQGEKLQDLMRISLADLDRAKKKDRLRLVEFFMLSIAHMNTLEKDYRANSTMVYNAPIIMSKENNLVFDLGAFFFNLTRIESCYSRFRGLAVKDGIDIIDEIEGADDGTLLSDFRTIATHKRCDINCQKPCEDRNDKSCSHYKAKWLSFCAFRNVEIMLDFLESISQTDIKYSTSDRLTLADFFEKCSKYEIYTYVKDNKYCDYHKISFGFLGKVANFLKNNTLENYFSDIFGMDTKTYPVSSMPLSNTDAKSIVDGNS